MTGEKEEMFCSTTSVQRDGQGGWMGEKKITSRLEIVFQTSVFF